MQLIDNTGRNCGNFDGEAPAGYWLRPDEAPDSLTRLEFLDRFGAARFATVWRAMQADPLLAFSVMRGFAAETVHLAVSFPELKQMEAAGLVPAGTAIEIWS